MTAYHDVQSWSDQNPGVQFVPFDVKYVSLLNAKSRCLDYEYSNRRLKGDADSLAEFFVIVFEGVYDHVAILPRETWLRARGATRGALSLEGGIPLWCEDFMVAVDPLQDLKDACDGMVLSAITGTPYQNPTTMVKMAYFRPEPTRTPAVGVDPDSDAPIYISEEKYDRLWKQIQSIGGRARLNPIAPLYFDFTVDLPAVGALRFEHKYVGVPDWYAGAWIKTQGRKSAFHSRRIWHVLWVDTKDGGVVVITRDDLKEEWQEHRPTKSYLQEHHFFGDFNAAVDHVRSHAEAARLAADAALHNIEAHEMDTDLVLNTNGKPKKKLFEYQEQDDSAVSGRLHVGHIGLPWLCAQLNQQCRDGGYGLVFPLETYHPLGNHVMVHYKWTEQDMERYDRSGRLPYPVYSRHLCQNDTRCIVLRFQDHSVRPEELGAGLQSRANERHSPLLMRHTFWWKLVEHQEGKALPFIILGNLLDKEILQQPEQRSSWYLLLPSEFTTMPHHEQLRPMPKRELKDKGGHMFLAVPSEYKRPPMPVANEGPAAFADPFVADGVNIMRYVLNLQDGTIYSVLCQILRTSGSMSIPNPQSIKQNRNFKSSSYHTTLSAVHQASWDFGCKLKHGCQRT
jgi:hypothetical protein